MLAESREQALQRMIEKWEDLNTDRIICVRFQTSMIMSITSLIACLRNSSKTSKNISSTIHF